MKIDLSTTMYAGTDLQPDQAARRILHQDGTHFLTEPDRIQPEVPDNGGAAVVSISDAGHLAADADEGMRPSSASIEATGNPVNSANSAMPAPNQPNALLDQLLVEMLSGRKINGVSAADLKAVRDSGANSDLLLQRIEKAALRAGFGIERQIAQEAVTVDQATFQAKGVLRTAHGS